MLQKRNAFLLTYGLLEDILKTKNIKYIKKYFPIIFRIDEEISSLCLKNKNTFEEKKRILEYFDNNTIESNFDKVQFIHNLEIISATSYDQLLNEIFSIMETYGHSMDEIKELLYPNIFQKVADLSSESDIEKRTIICGDFKNKVFSLKSLLTSKWLKTICRKEVYKKSLKRHLKIRLQGNSSFRIIILDAEKYKITELSSFINDYVKKYNRKPMLNSCPIFIISSKNEKTCSLIQQSLYEDYDLNFEDGDVGKKFNLKKLITTKENVNLKICYNHKQLGKYIIQHKPDDLFIIGNIDTNLYEKNDLEYCKIEGLNMQEVKEIFFLGGNYEGNR